MSKLEKQWKRMNWDCEYFVKVCDQFLIIVDDGWVYYICKQLQFVVYIEKRYLSGCQEGK